MPASALHNANTILPIDPTTSTTDTPIPVGNDPGALAASEDGKYLYVGLNAAHSLQRINLAAGAVDRTFPLPVDPYLGSLVVGDLHTVPGTSTSVVVVLSANASPSEDGIALFNDSGMVNYISGTAAQYGMPSVMLDSFTFLGKDASRIYGLPFDIGQFFTTLTLDGAGVHYTRPAGGSTTTAPPTGNQVVFDGSLLYTNTGQVWDPQSHQLIATYPVGNTQLGAVVPDTAQGKTYYLDSLGLFDQRAALSIRGFDQSTVAETGRVSFGEDPQSGFPLFSEQLLRWGTNGFAFRYSNYPTGSTQDDSIVMFTSSIANASNLNPTPLATTLSPATYAAAGADFTLTVTGAGFVKGSAVLWNGAPRLTTFVSPTTLTASIYASDIAAPGMVQVYVESPGPGGGFSAALSFAIMGGNIVPAPTLTLTPGNLSFPSQAVGIASAAQSLTVQNTGAADVTGITLSLSGSASSSFSTAGTCFATIAANATCRIDVVYTPVAAGDATASLIITSSASGSPQTVSLSGSATAAAFTVAPPANGSGTTTVPSGQTADFSLVLTPTPSYTGTLTLSCGNLPAHAACSFTPSALTITSGTPTNFMLAISTADAHASASSLLTHGSGPLLALCLLPFWRRARQLRRGGLLGVLCLLSLTVAVGCGGNASNGVQSATPSASSVASGSYTIQVIATDGVSTSKTPITLLVK